MIKTYILLPCFQRFSLFSKVYLKLKLWVVKLLKLNSENHDLTIRHKMLSFGNTFCAAQMSARPKSSFPFYEKLYTYVSPRVSAWFKWHGSAFSSCFEISIYNWLCMISMTPQYLKLSAVPAQWTMFFCMFIAEIIVWLTSHCTVGSSVSIRVTSLEQLILAEYSGE